MTWTVPDQGEPANDLQAVLFQSSLDALAGGPARTGVLTGCAVTAQASPDMTVAVAAGTVSIAGATGSVTAGNVTIGAADATNPRLDLVVSDGSGTKSVIAGTAAAAPKEATLDTTTYVLLAQVYVPATATTITTARITDRRVILADPGFTEARMVPSGGSPGVSIPGAEILSAATFTMSPNRANYMPFVVRSTISIDQFVCDVTTNVAAANVRFAIYKSDANGQPTSLVVDSGDISVATTGVKTTTVSATLPPGRYLFWTNASAASIVLRSWRVAMEYVASAPNSVMGQYFVAQTYGAPPSTGLAWTTTATGSGVEYVFLSRRSA